MQMNTFFGFALQFRLENMSLLCLDINFVRGHLEDESMDYSGGLV